MVKLILFDFDGPLADSLNKHIEFCWRINNKYQGPLVLPAISDLAAWKLLIGFPMVKFLTNLGFSEEQAQLIHDQDYLEEFGDQKHPAPLYPGVPELISRLKNRDYRLGIISLNNRCNILASLGPLAEVFEPIYSCNEFPEKPLALLAACSLVGCAPEEAVYIGDALKDYQAADEIGMPFFGVSYGWQITGQENEFVSAENPEQLEAMLLSL